MYNNCKPWVFQEKWSVNKFWLQKDTIAHNMIDIKYLQEKNFEQTNYQSKEIKAPFTDE